MRHLLLLVATLSACDMSGTAPQNDGGGALAANQGPPGDTGAVGPAGPAGLQGPQGLQGTSGVNGAPGLQGPTGPQGPAGAMGAQGPAGVSNVPGPQGPAGPSGPAGAASTVPGPQGSIGPAGPVGAAGPRGLPGATLAIYDNLGKRLGYIAPGAPPDSNTGSGPGFVTDANGNGIPDGLYYRGADRFVFFANANCQGQAYTDPVSLMTISNELFYAAAAGTGTFYKWSGSITASVTTASRSAAGACVNAPTGPGNMAFMISVGTGQMPRPWSIKVE